MAYNPFDDVIDQDPAYMADGGTRSGIIQPVTTDQGPRYISQAIADFYKKITPEEELKQQIASKEESQMKLLQESQPMIQAIQQMKPNSLEQLTAIRNLEKDLYDRGYQNFNMQEILGMTGQFLYGDQRKAFDKLAAAEPLNADDRMAIAFAPLDLLDFISPGIVAKLTKRGFSKVDDVLKASSDIPEVKQVQDYLGGQGFTPAGVVREAEKGSGLTSSQTPIGKGMGTGQRYKETGLPKDVYFKSYVKPEQAKDIEKLADILNKTSIEDMNKPLKQIMVDNNLNSLLRVESKAREKEKIIPAQFVKQTLKRYEMVPEEKLNKLTEITTKQPFRGGQQDKEKIQKFLEDSIESGKTFNFEKDMAKEVGMTGSKFATILFRNPSLKKLSKDLIEDTSSFSVEKYLKKNKDELGLTAINSRGNKNDRNEYLLFDGLIRSLSAQDIGLKPGATRREKTEKFIDYVKENIPDWKNVFREELNNLAYVDQQRNVANKTIKEMFNDYAERFPEQFKNENLNEYLLQVSHNYPLREDFRVFKGGGADIDSVRLAPSRTNNVHHAKIEKEVTKLKNKIEQQGKATEQQMKELKKLDQQAKELGTLVYTKIGDEYVAIGTEKAPGINTIVNSIEKYFQEISKRKGAGRIVKGEIMPMKFKEKQIKVKGKYGDVLEPRPFQKGGAVRMAMGGDPLQNINQQQFASDPGIDGEDYFNQAVESGNLYAFNPSKIFKSLMKTDSVYTPKKIKQSLPETPDLPEGTTLPATQTLQPEDFAFQSFTLNKIMDKNAPKAARPQDWANYLTGGQPAPLSEIQDTGLEQYLRDFESYFPNQKITQQQLVDFYETSPIGNIEIKVKEARNNLNRFEPGYTNDPAYTGYTGKAQHQNSGSQPLDGSGKDYREIVVTSGPLPGDKNPYVQSGHYQEENVLGFTRVANYEQPNGAKVAVIQEMQTDMLTKVRKEQERVQALLKRIQNMQENAAIEMGSGEAWRIDRGQSILNNLERNVPTEARKALEKFSNLIKPYPNTAAKDLIPGYAGDLSKLQDEINAIVAKDIEQKLPETSSMLRDISGKQEDILNKLLDLNRSSELDQVLKGVQVPATRNTDELADYANASRPTSIEPGGYGNMKDLELFPPIPFNKQADYVDLLIKSTIKDAQSKGINKVAIYPSELVNKRWGKAPDSDAGKKFRDLYDNVGQQTMKNIAKKYGGEAKFEVILDPNKSDRGLTFLQKDVDGNYFMSKQDALASDLSFGEQQQFIDSELARAAHNMGVDSIIYSKEVAPGQTMDYWVNPTGPSQGIPRQDLTFELVPLKPGDDINSAAVRIEEYNPQEIPMFTITLDSEKAKAPMFMFKKKSGGIIDKDSLISITDIYGEYGR